MSLADKLSNIYTDLNTALNDANSALVEKGGNEVADISSIGDEIRELPDELATGLIDGSATNIELNGMTTIRNWAFTFHETLKEVIIGETVTEIGDNAFNNCQVLEKITIGSRVESIGNNAFYVCISLADIYLYPIIPPTLTSKNFNSTTIIHIPIGSGDAYKSATNWSNYADNIVEDIVVE